MQNLPLGSGVELCYNFAKGGEAVKKWILAVLLAVLLVGCTAPAQPEEPPYTLPQSLYTPQDFTSMGGYLVCTAGQTVTGIDVSSHQGLIDWQQVADAGIRFAFVRLGYRGYESGVLQNDLYVDMNLQGAKAAGLAVGAYFFSQAVTVEEAQEEAAFALRILGGFSLELPLVFDWEYVSETARTAHVDNATVTACTLAFCQAVEQAGYRPAVYFNTHQLGKLAMEELQEYPWWYAKYDLEAGFPCKVDLWQYTDEGSVPGIDAKVDINLMFTDYGLGKELFGE